MKLSSLINVPSALTLASMLHFSLALPTKQLLQERQLVKELLPQCVKRTTPYNISYNVFVGWPEVGQATPDAVSTIYASPDASSTSFIPPEYIPVPAGLDALLFSFRVVNGLVEPSAGAQFRNTKEVNEKATDYQSIGPFPIQLGAGATGDGAQGPPPQVIQFGVQRGADTGTGVLEIAKCLEDPTV